MGEVWVTGPEAAAFLDYALVGKISAMAIGKAKYSLICQEDGGIIDDLITYRRRAEPDRFLVVPNAGNAKVVAAALLERAAGFDVVVEDASADTSLIAVQGPLAEAILLRLVPAEQHALVTELKYYAAVEVPFTFDGGTQDLLLARTGYTGEDGFEIFVANESAAALWQAIAAAAKKASSSPPASPPATPSASKPACPSTATNSPAKATPSQQDSDPSWRCPRKATSSAKRHSQPSRQTAPAPPADANSWASRASGRRAGRGHYPVLKDGAVVGEVTSGQPSPTLGYPVALAYVDVDYCRAWHRPGHRPPG